MPVVAGATSPTTTLPKEAVQEILLLTASGSHKDRHNLEELVKLFRQTDRVYSDLEEVFLPAFLSYSRGDLLQVLVDDRQEVLDVLQFGEHSAWFVYQILTQKPLPEATPAVARLLLASPDWEPFQNNGSWEAYFALAVENDPTFERTLLDRIVRDSRAPYLSVLAIQRLAELVDHDPEGLVAQRLSRELIPPRSTRSPQRLQGSARRVLGAALEAFDHWQSKAGIDLIVEEMQRYDDSLPYFRHLPRVSMPLICGSQTRATASEANRAFSEWWKSHREEVAWDSSSERWIADKSWLLCGQAEEEGRVIWDKDTTRYIMYRSPAAATVGRWTLEIKRHLRTIFLLSLLPTFLIFRTIRSRRKHLHSSEP